MTDTTCLDLRRQLTSEPRSSDLALVQHIGGCESCATFHRDMLATEDSLRLAMQIDVPANLAARIRVQQTMAEARNDDFEQELAVAMKVPPPDNLSQRILDRNALSRARSKRRGSITQYALAASVAMAVAIGSILMLRPTDALSDDPVMSAVVAHSQVHILDVSKSISNADLTPLLHLVGLAPGSTPVGLIRSATACDVRDKHALHLVVSGQLGPVNVFVMPEESSVQTQRDSSGRNWRGLVFPVKHGSMAVVGHPEEDLGMYARQVRGALRWQM